MQFAMATSDEYQCVFEAFIKAGWTPVKLFLSSGENRQVITRALELQIPIQNSPITQTDLADLKWLKCHALVVASYQWKIPDWQSFMPYAINFHPSPLPLGRGPYPLIRAISENYTDWAITCHKINEQYDSGDILDSEPYLIDADETLESLKLKTLLSSVKLAERIATDLAVLWEAATPQKTGSYWPLWAEQERTIDFTQSITSIMRQIRAFGDIECIAVLNDLNIYVHRASSWSEAHNHAAGKVVFSSNLALVVSAVDGFVAITEWSFNEPNAVIAHLRK
ncbi:MAG TPA: formyltransferase family protein [Methylophilaceae bacterium]|jgi:methionyl-tRNA formyltransferase